MKQNFDILDHTPIGHFVLRHDFVVMFWNRCLEDWTGLSREKIVDCNILTYFPHLNNPKYLQRIKQVLAGNMPSTVFSSQLHQYMIPVTLADGGMRTQYTVVTQLKSEDTENSYVLFSIQDVTDLTAAIHSNRNAYQRISRAMDELKTTEQQLAEKSTYLDNILRSATEYAIITTDIEFQVTYFNPMAERLFECSAADKIGSSLQLIFEQDFGSGVDFDTVTDKVLHRGESVFTICREDVDDSQYIQVRVSGILNDDQHIIGVALFCWDVTEKRSQQEKLRKLSQAIEQAGESIVITDSEGVIEYANPAFTRLTGYEAEEVVGKNPRILKSGQQDHSFYQNMWETIISGDVWQKPLVDRKKDGSFYPAIMSVAPIVDDQDEITHYVGIQQDMSEYQALEERFRQAQKMEAIGTLVGGIAHDFNNMLAGITGNLYLATQKVQDRPEVLKKLQTIESLSFKAGGMIQQLLTFARKGLIEIKPFGLTSFLSEAARLNESGVPENIVLKKKICSQELVIRGDVTQLQQVLMNLLNNAVDALDGFEEPEIVIGLEFAEADHVNFELPPETEAIGFAHFYVSDNGPGISKENLDNIFEPFFTTKEVGKGTGLGLAMIYGAIKSHDGLIEVETEQGRGATFHIYLPLISEEEFIGRVQLDDAVITGAGQTLLVVDDNSAVRQTAKEVLESVGYRVLVAIDGLDAVNVFKKHMEQIDLIILDIVMPRMGGVKAAEQIQAIKPGMKIIYATGYDKDETLGNEMPQGDNIILSKPYAIGDLSQVLHKLLNP